MGLIGVEGWSLVQGAFSLNGLFGASLACLFIFLYRRFFAKPKYIELPAWAVVEIALTSYLVAAGGMGQKFLSRFRRQSGSFFGLTNAHQVIYNVPNAERVLAASQSSFDFRPLQWTMFSRVFGVPTDALLHEKFTPVLARALTVAVEKVFVNESAATALLYRADVPAKAAALVSLSPGGGAEKQLRPWERSADVRPVSAAAVEANLHALLRDFGACVAIPLLYGQDFLDRHPTLLADFWRFDNDLFPLAIVGVPTWLPLRVVRDGVAARKRVNDALGDVSRRLDQHNRGEPVDDGVDMGDASYTVIERSRQMIKHAVPLSYRGSMELGLLWGQNANTQPLIFWLVAYIYSTPGLLDALRAEIAPFVVASSSDTSTPPSITSFDLVALSRDCPLLNSAMLETLRLCNEPTSIRYVARDTSVPDGSAASSSSPAPAHHPLRAGSWLSIPHGVVQHDAAVFPSPAEFVPDRFLEVDAESGRRVVRYGRLKPWGAGHGICKGRIFAEREILAVAACVVSLWDMEPAGGGPDARWKLPAMRPGTGVMKPVGDLRVIIRRRVLPAER